MRPPSRRCSSAAWARAFWSLAAAWLISCSRARQRWLSVWISRSARRSSCRAARRASLAERAAAASAWARLRASASSAARTAAWPSWPRATPTRATASGGSPLARASACRPARIRRASTSSSWSTRSSTAARNFWSRSRVRRTTESTRGCLSRRGVQVWYWRSCPGRVAGVDARRVARAASIYPTSNASARSGTGTGAPASPTASPATASPSPMAPPAAAPPAGTGAPAGSTVSVSSQVESARSGSDPVGACPGVLMGPLTAPPARSPPRPTAPGSPRPAWSSRTSDSGPPRRWPPAPAPPRWSAPPPASSARTRPSAGWRRRRSGSDCRRRRSGGAHPPRAGGTVDSTGWTHILLRRDGPVSDGPSLIGSSKRVVALAMCWFVNLFPHLFARDSSPGTMLPIVEKIAFTFPGQGRIPKGSGAPWADDPAGWPFQRASMRLGWDVIDVIESGDAVLADTRKAQPAIYTHSAACFLLAKAEGFRPDLVAGHSLGEYAAVLAAGGITFEQGLDLVVRRAELAHATAGAGVMQVILGLPDKTVGELCRKVRRQVGKVFLANSNAPGQVVISGESAAVEEAGRRALA